MCGSVGAARDRLETAIGYARERIIFDKPLAAFQATHLKRADMTLKLGKALLLAVHLASLKDGGRRRPEASQPGPSQQRPRVNRDRSRVPDDPDGRGPHGRVPRHAPRHILESVLTYEGTSEVHKLVIGQALIGFPRAADRQGRGVSCWPTR